MLNALYLHDQLRDGGHTAAFFHGDTPDIQVKPGLTFLPVQAEPLNQFQGSVPQGLR
jgi:hypothetical protein